MANGNNTTTTNEQTANAPSKKNVNILHLSSNLIGLLLYRMHNANTLNPAPSYSDLVTANSKYPQKYAVGDIVNAYAIAITDTATDENIKTYMSEVGKFLAKNDLAFNFFTKPLEDPNVKSFIEKSLLSFNKDTSIELREAQIKEKVAQVFSAERHISSELYEGENAGVGNAIDGSFKAQAQELVLKKLLKDINFKNPSKK